MTTTVTTVGQYWVNDALVFEPAEYNCFSYQLAVDSTFIPTDQAALRFCEYQPLPGNTPPLEANELDSWDINVSDQPEYTPVVRDWSSLALFRGAFTDQSSNAVTAKLAVDSEIVNGSFANATPAQTDLQANPWWQVDLGASEAIGKIRLWTPPASLSNAYVLVSNTDFRTIPGHENPANLLNRPDVQAYTLADLGSGLTMTGTAGSVATFTTLNAQHLPITGRYVRVQRADTAKLVLAEVQVFGANHVEPNRYPLNVRDTAPNDGMFEVQLYNPLAQNVTYEWKKVRGNLLWYEPQNGLLNGLTIGRGNAIRDWSLSKAVGQGQAQAHELDNSTSVGAELEAEAGVGVKVLAGVGKENTVGLATEVVESTSWTNEFNMGGLMQAFPPTYNGHENDWVENCRYRFIPYQYEVTETSNLGYHQRFPVLDYVVPDDNRASDLHRTSNVMPDCRNGNLLSSTPQAVNDTVVITAPVPTGIQVLANDLGNELKIVDAGPAQNGNVIFASRTITYTPNAGFQGIDSFNYVMAPDAAAACRRSSYGWRRDDRYGDSYGGHRRTRDPAVGLFAVRPALTERRLGPVWVRLAAINSSGTAHCGGPAATRSISSAYGARVWKIASNHHVAPAWAYSDINELPSASEMPSTATSNGSSALRWLRIMPTCCAIWSGVIVTFCCSSTVPMIQPSQRAARRSAARLPPPIQTGIRGCCTGDGARRTVSAWK